MILVCQRGPLVYTHEYNGTHVSVCAYKGPLVYMHIRVYHCVPIRIRKTHPNFNILCPNIVDYGSQENGSSPFKDL